MVDYRIWGVVQQRVYQSWVHDTDELKQCVQQVWRYVDQSMIDNAIGKIHPLFGSERILKIG